MKIVHEEIILNEPMEGTEDDLEVALSEVRKAIGSICWPPGSDRMHLNPSRNRKKETGKKTTTYGGNSPSQMKLAFAEGIVAQHWDAEVTVEVVDGERVGNVDFVSHKSSGLYCVEWETGNVASCHRSVNKMALGLLTNAIRMGILIVPSAEMYPYLTHRTANYREISPYRHLWKYLTFKQGYLSMIVVEHDEIDGSVPVIPKKQIYGSMNSAFNGGDGMDDYWVDDE